MSREQQFDEALRRFDAANAEDPRTATHGGVRRPRELLFATRVYEWVRRLVSAPSEALLLAARGHTLRRWAIPRDRYSRDNIGYHEWRDALARFHADEAGAILRDVGYADDVIARVQALIRRELWPKDPDARALEDADCLAFLELKLHHYVDEWDDAKTVQILRSTLRKMTPAARDLAGQIPLGPREQELLRRAN
jgi:hypothetical protein